MRKTEQGGTGFGAAYKKDKTTFRVWSPGAEAVRVNLYRTGSDQEAGSGLILQHELQKKEDGVWEKSLEGDWDNTYYTYSILREGVLTETADVYTKACGVNGERSMVVDLESTDPEGFRENREWIRKRKEAVKVPVIYELHIQDFSSDKSSGISPAHRGKYLAFTEKETTVDQKGEHVSGIEYLKTLGITHVHLLPFFVFGSVDESGDCTRQFNWGYDPVHYQTPTGAYSTDPYHGKTRLRECKQMIQALHEAGIGVIMDVVFNHTYSTDSVFQKTVPDYYYRKEKDGSFCNGSMCGNDTASEKKMFRQYMIDSLIYWAQEYEIDGFRFDLMALHDVETMNQIRKALNALPDGKDLLMYGEPWMADSSLMEEGSVSADKEHRRLLDPQIAIFSDDTRDAIKGDVFIAGESGYVNGNPENAALIRSAVTAWGGPASQIISYVSAHDNFTLWDKLFYTMPENKGKTKKEISFSQPNPEIIRQNKLAAAIYFTCLGCVFFQAGEEFGRTKQGEENSYNLSPKLNALDWELAVRMQDLTDYYKMLIAFRKKHEAIYGKEKQDVQIHFGKCPDPEMVAFESYPEGHREQGIFVIYNQSRNKSILRLPEGDWKIVTGGNEFYNDPEEKDKKRKKILVNCQTAVILERKS